MTECQKTHKCEDCGKHSRHHEDEEWPCIWSHCKHHPSVTCEFVEK